MIGQIFDGISTVLIGIISDKSAYVSKSFFSSLSIGNITNITEGVILVNREYVIGNVVGAFFLCL